MTQSNLTKDDSAVLLAIVEVAQSERVTCQADGCGHFVYKRIHVVKIAGAIKVFGSACFDRLFAGRNQTFSIPAFGSSSGRRLTDEERLLLLQNTEKLIAMLEAEHTYQLKLAQERESERLVKLEHVQQQRLASVKHAHHSANRKSVRSPYSSTRIVYAGDKWDAAMRAAKLKMQSENPGVDLNIAGFSGLILMEARKLFREM